MRGRLEPARPAVHVARRRRGVRARLGAPAEGPESERARDLLLQRRAVSASPQARWTSTSSPRLTATDMPAGRLAAMYARTIEPMRAAAACFESG